jgi:hypothetical protein
MSLASVSRSLLEAIVQNSVGNQADENQNRRQSYSDSFVAPLFRALESSIAKDFKTRNLDVLRLTI